MSRTVRGLDAVQVGRMVITYFLLVLDQKTADGGENPQADTVRTKLSVCFPEAPYVLQHAVERFRRPAGRQESVSPFEENLTELVHALYSVLLISTADPSGDDRLMSEEVAEAFERACSSLPAREREKLWLDPYQNDRVQKRARWEMRRRQSAVHLRSVMLDPGGDVEMGMRVLAEGKERTFDNRKNRILWSTACGYLDAMGYGGEKEDDGLRSGVLFGLRRVHPDFVRFFLYRSNEIARDMKGPLYENLLAKKQYACGRQTRRLFGSIQLYETTVMGDLLEKDMDVPEDPTEQLSEHLAFYGILGRTQAKG